MTSRLSLAALFLPLVALAGCGGTQNRGVESVHQPVVSHTDLPIELATRYGDLPPVERGRLAGWLTALKLGYGDRVWVEGAEGETPAIREAVGEVVGGFGLLLAERPVMGTPVPAGMVRVVVSRAQASVPGCPDWSRNGSINFDQHTSSDYGCSVNSNLAAMIADPRDLVQGKTGDGLTDPVRAAKPVTEYRKAGLTGGGGATVKAESAKGGN